ncbi:MAG: hypothetical protein Q9179_001216 [Wetmoreana sp. 5 TL-2023]
MLLQDRNQFLTKINNEGKVRRSTESETLGKARVMNFEDLEKARAERVVKEAAKEAKKAAKEAEEGAKEVKKLATAQVEHEIAPQPWRAPVSLNRSEAGSRGLGVLLLFD